MPTLPSYRNQSTDLQSKSNDSFLYEDNTAFNGLSDFERINQILVTLKSPDNLWFSDDFRGNKIQLIW